jgi:hypothetical protein
MSAQSDCRLIHTLPRTSVCMLCCSEKNSAITSRQFDERVRALGDKYLARS